jgi:hypothetical protein
MFQQERSATVDGHVLPILNSDKEVGQDDTLHLRRKYIFTCMSVTIEGFWFDDRIY